MIENIIIGIVLDQALTGYDIKKEIELGIGNFVKVSNGSLYPILKKLTEKRLVTMKEESHGKRIKKYYKATAHGKEVFNEWILSPLSEEALTINILSRVYFFDKFPQDLRIQKINEYELCVKEVIQGLNKLEQKIEVAETVGYYDISTLYFGLGMTQELLKWLHHIKEERALTEFIKNKEEERYNA